MFLRRFALGLVALGVAGAGQPARAVMVRFDFSGEIDWVADTYDIFGGSIHPGDPFTGSYVFDSTIPDSLPLDPEQGQYESPTSLMTVSMSDLTLTAAGGDCIIGIRNLEGYDELYLKASSFESPDLHISEVGVCLIDRTGTALASDGLPLWPLDVNAFQERQFGVIGESHAAEWFKIGGTVTSLTFVPEPDGLVVLVLGGWATVQRKRGDRWQLLRG